MELGGIPAEESRLGNGGEARKHKFSAVINPINSDANVVNRDEAGCYVRRDPHFQRRKPQVNQQRLSGEILSWNRSDHGGRMLMLEW
ncbi:hypothetical protein PCANC_02180 [Puccinia coronata f. sp. avenae]|uniref:Uncharacterized protein n=1 Tax=Puccinia coronata f. sp. avenae TaxID=200324 RepID=A0A2N5W0W1_9BASI|nr:hypothetical protein PCANC_02180 [Puccinia coronata f. sp. avenae]